MIGLTSQFKTPEKFIEAVKKEYKSITNKDCNVKDVILEKCISSERGLPGDCVVPMSATDVEIKVYYMGTITELE